ncbi:uncharacterized protein BDZ99DRAFT_503285 [Mytilinidion resinicola]|uniref:Uncharacterized protein n=1 Tax=Mytilinidion resinicola TaxID=574789 RepID=A0A6A6Y329_9PEZI|nr:uncharacterized protein BDZ99DRAFT_503285 [Mytilinidion resinicola]KAF2803236.1 hypothetical protein BDZ99DRAFT_503285 [Mytilinidion resinicola]
MGDGSVELREHGTKRDDNCLVRSDDAGIWNYIKAWHWFPLHLACCICFIVVMFLLVDNHTFLSGTTPDSDLRRSGFYQTEVTGLVSAALVLIRLVAGVGSALVLWRLIFILLEKSGLTLAEICRLADKKLPILPRFESSSQSLWSCFAFVVVILLWPQTIAAPLANSSLAWTPSTKLASASSSQNYILNTLNDPKDKDSFVYANLITRVIFIASFMAGKNPDYAFAALRDSQIPLRRYSYLIPSLNDGGLGSFGLPYFEVINLKWIDAPDGRQLNQMDNSSMLEDPVTPEVFAPVGNLAFLRDTKWLANETVDLYEPQIFEGKKNVSVKVDGTYLGQIIDGKNVTEDTPCPTVGDVFGKLPSVQRFHRGYYVSNDWRANDCYLLAEVTIKAGIYPKRFSNVTLVGSSDHVHAISPIGGADDANPSLIPDGSVGPVLDMMSDVARLIIALNLTSDWQKDNIDNFVKGMLSMSYHSTWSAMPVIINDNTEAVDVTPMEPVILASVDKRRLYAWLGMNLALTVAALLVGVAHHWTTTRIKTIRDTTLAALTIDISKISHQSGSGLCNASALNGDDHAIGRMKWKDDNDMETYHMTDETHRDGCRRELDVAATYNTQPIRENIPCSPHSRQTPRTNLDVFPGSQIIGQLV